MRGAPFGAPHPFVACSPVPSPRLPLRLLALVAAVALLAGCRLDLDVAVDMAEDGSGTVTVTATADAELLAKAPGVLADLRLDDARTAGWTVTGRSRLSDGGAQVVLTKPFGVTGAGDGHPGARSMGRAGRCEASRSRSNVSSLG